MTITDVGPEIAVTRRKLGMSARELARVAGVSPSTVTRLEQGALPNASYEVVSRILDACNLDGTLRPRCRPSALASARILLGDDLEEPEDFQSWVDTWESSGITSDPRLLCRRAGRAAKLNMRPKALNLERTMDWREAATRLKAANIDWVNTGDSAANRLISYADQPWPVFYVSDLGRARDALGAPACIPGVASARITLIAFDGTNQAGAWQDVDGMWFASPWQVVLDCYAGVGRMAVQADAILDSWGIR